MRRIHAVSAACVLMAGAAACASPGPGLVLLNARAFTADPARPWAEALAVRGDRVIAVGTTAEVERLADARTVRRDLGGRTVVPGFNDAHVDDTGLSAQGFRDLGRAAVTAGITSVQLFVGGRTVKEAARALTDAGLLLRVRVLRMPRPGPNGDTIDSRPHLPPQPALRLDIRGMAFGLGDGDGARIRQAVEWAYGTEDLLALEPTSAAALHLYLDAIEQTGLADVWARKRPRVEHPGPAAAAVAPRLAANGMVVVERPGARAPLRTLLRQGVRLALASGGGLRPFDVLAWATGPDLGVEALTMEEAVMALTRGSAYAELADRDKGHLTVGALADLAVLSIDPFTAAPDALAGARSVLTLVGGRIVHDVP